MNDRRGFRTGLFLGLMVTAALTLSCAGPNKLAQQSEKAYSKGEVEKAFQKEARALRKEPENRRAGGGLTQGGDSAYGGREVALRGSTLRARLALGLDRAGRYRH